MGLREFFRRGEPRPADAGEPASSASDDEVAELADRAADLSYSFGRMRPDEQRAAALERLTELRAAGRVSEENYLKEKRRLEGWG